MAACHWLWSNLFITARTILREFVRQCVSIWARLNRQQVINIVIIKVSRYDGEDGFVNRSWKAILPSNTQSTICSLIRDIQKNWRLGMKTKIIMREYDETVQDVSPAWISLLCRTFPNKTLVMLVGVQTNEFARATDLALDFQARGIQVVIGGFHVSGVLKQFPEDDSTMSRRAHRELGLERLIASGVTFFAGEAEGRMLRLLQDFQQGKLNRIYNYLDDKPNLVQEIAPEPLWSLRHYFAFPQSSTIDACRGCPYNCDFCTIRNVQGTKIRARGVQVFCDAIRHNWRKGVNSYFFTSDNASRDPLWRERFDALIDMRKEEGIRVSFMVQVDTQCHKIPGFIAKAAAAGCTTAFIGLETVNPANLKEIGKGQNHVNQYRDLNKAWREVGVAVQYGYMIGLPQDTIESIVRDVDTLMDLEPDLITFFIATPLPGANDHTGFFKAGVAMDSDLNSYDCFSGVVKDHPLMSREELLSAYNYAWQKVYSVENMVRILRANTRENYWRRFWSLTWYKNSLDVTGRHPMVTGFIRLRSRHSRRQTFRQMAWLEFQLYNLRENFRMWRKTTGLARIMVEVWLQSRERSEIEQAIASLADSRSGRWASLRVADLRRIYQAKGLRVPRLSQLNRQLIIARTTRQDIEEYWVVLKEKISQGRIWELFRPRSIRFATVDIYLHLLFLKKLLSGSRTNL